MGGFLGFIGFIGFLAVVYFVIKRSKSKARGDGGEFTKPTPPSDEK